MKTKYRWLDRRVAKPAPYLTLCLSEAEQRSALRGLTKSNVEFPKTGALCTTMHHEKTDELCAVVSVSQHSQDTCNAMEMAGLLIHEAVHIWQRYSTDMGETNPGIEQEAYAIQALSQSLLAEYARRLDSKI
jgi:hypothetical protein